MEQGFIPEGINKAPSPEKLYQMTAAQMVSLTISDGSEKGIKDRSHAELTEAAFMFETQLMDLLGDINPIAFESYAKLSHSQLTGIIKNCAGQICQIESAG